MRPESVFAAVVYTLVVNIAANSVADSISSKLRSLRRVADLQTRCKELNGLITVCALLYAAWYGVVWSSGRSPHHVSHLKQS